MKPILLFDIDGTLLHVKRSFMKDVMQCILEDLQIRENPLADMSFAGRTDRDIFNEMAGLLAHESHNKEELFYQIKESYLNIVLKELSAEHLNVIEGAFEAVQAAAEHQIHMGLCTGNFREAAHKKLKAAGFDVVFNFGGFGCEHADRKHLPEAAHQEYVEYSGSVPQRDHYMIIGDTPNDIRSAQYFGAKSVAVTTGHFSKDHLQKHKPDRIVDSLQELLPF